MKGVFQKKEATVRAIHAEWSTVQVDFFYTKRSLTRVNKSGHGR